MRAESLAHPVLGRLAEQLTTYVPVDGLHAAAGARWLAAVAAVFRVRDGTLELLFIKRAEHAGDPWSGHMAFPGGRHEPEDESLEQTAIRETREELALDLTAGQLLGRLDDLAPINPSLPPFVLRPFVAVVPAAVDLQPSHEVAATYWVPFEQLRHEDTRTEHVMTINGKSATFPGFRVDTHVVWGLTGRIVRQLLSLTTP